MHEATTPTPPETLPELFTTTPPPSTVTAADVCWNNLCMDLLSFDDGVDLEGRRCPLSHIPQEHYAACVRLMEQLRTLSWIGYQTLQDDPRPTIWAHAVHLHSPAGHDHLAQLGKQFGPPFRPVAHRYVGRLVPYGLPERDCLRFLAGRRQDDTIGNSISKYPYIQAFFTSPDPEATTPQGDQ